jgi:hypothetical protein
MKKIIVGHNFLHQHPRMQISLRLDEDHVIVDKIDFGKAVEFFRNHPEFEQELLNGCDILEIEPTKKKQYCKCGIFSIGCNAIKTVICPNCRLPIKPE